MSHDKIEKYFKYVEKNIKEDKYEDAIYELNLIRDELENLKNKPKDKKK